ncbi:hypothetical protein F5Y04DRAFT_287477 [Hypomontagnella monticulosa]|nr:hypothetical protein F5Y04DRAFT_287477 [Hypomontagnella monticulosa]
MATTSQLVVGNVDIHTIFDDIISFLDNIHLGQEDGQPTSKYRLQVGVLKLRLCRWRDVVMEFFEANEEPIDGPTVGQFFQNQLVDMKNLYKENTKETDPDDCMARELNSLSRGHYGQPRSTRRHPIIDCEELMVKLANIVERMEDHIHAEKFSDRLAVMRFRDMASILGSAARPDYRRLRDSSLSIDRKFVTLFINTDNHQYCNVTSTIDGRLRVGDSTIRHGWTILVPGASHTYMDVRGKLGWDELRNMYSGPDTEVAKLRAGASGVETIKKSEVDDDDDDGNGDKTVHI